MTALLTFLAGKAATYFVGAAVIIAAFAATFIKGRLSGAALERQKQAASEARAKSVADEIDDAVAGRTPDANRNELKDWTPR